MKKAIMFLMFAIAIPGVMSGCSAGGSKAFNPAKLIDVVSREDGSGTRGAFIELFGIEMKSDDGARKDMTTKEAIIAKQTDVMMTNIAGNPYAIGYISLGSLNDMVKAVQIDGVQASAENVKNGTYSIARPFIMAANSHPSALAQDFIDFILSAEGQMVVGKSYIAIDAAASAYAGNRPPGKIVIGGSTSVAPVMEKLKEAYLPLNPNASIEIQQIDSTAGMVGVIDGIYDIGMSSRALKDGELAELTPIQIAFDGIVIIVNRDNPTANLTKAQVKSIFVGETENWGGVGK